MLPVGSAIKMIVERSPATLGDLGLSPGGATPRRRWSWNHQLGILSRKRSANILSARLNPPHRVKVQRRLFASYNTVLNARCLKNVTSLSNV